MSVGLLARVHNWDGFEAACDELQACSADVARFLEAEMAELDRWQTALQQASAVGVATASASVSGPFVRGQLDADPLDAPDNAAASRESSAHTAQGNELVARLELLCERFEGELQRAAVAAKADASHGDGEDEAPDLLETVRPDRDDQALQSYRRRLRALAEQVLILERDRCGTAAELAAARLRARELACELKRQKNAFTLERRRWLKRLSAIQRALEGLSARDEVSGSLGKISSERGSSQKIDTHGTAKAGLTDELLIEAILAKCEMSAESRAG